MHVVLLGTKKDVMQALVAGGHEVTLLYEPWEEFRVAPHRARAKHWCLVDSHLSVESLWSALHHVGALDGPIDAVVSTGELGVVPAALLGKLLGARSMTPEVALACRDKAVQKAAWRAAGVPTPRWVVVPDARAAPESVRPRVAAAGLRAPFIVKPIAGYATRNVAVARDEDELDTIVAKMAKDDPALGRLMVEQRQSGGEWHFDGLVRDGELLALHVSQYLEPLIETKNGHPTASISYPPHANFELYEAARAFAKRALDALGMTVGVFHLEVFAEPDTHDFVAGELAGRPGGNFIGPLVKRVVGVDIWAASVQLFTGDEIERASTVSPHVCGWTDLPATGGRLNRVKPEDVLAIPGVVDVMVTTPYGAPMRDMRESSATNIGYALVEGSDRDACRATIARVVAMVLETNSKPDAIAQAPAEVRA